MNQLTLSVVDIRPRTITGRTSHVGLKVPVVWFVQETIAGTSLQAHECIVARMACNITWYISG